jgi:hypothetical protein
MPGEKATPHKKVYQARSGPKPFTYLHAGEKVGGGASPPTQAGEKVGVGRCFFVHPHMCNGAVAPPTFLIELGGGHPASPPSGAPPI